MNKQGLVGDTMGKLASFETVLSDLQRVAILPVT